MEAMFYLLGKRSFEVELTRSRREAASSDWPGFEPYVLRTAGLVRLRSPEINRILHRIVSFAVPAGS